MMVRKHLTEIPGAPKAIGPYSLAIVDEFDDHVDVFVSGQLPLDPDSGSLVQDDVAVQTHRVMANIVACLTAAGATADDISKAKIYLAGMGDFQTVNGVYGSYFARVFPTRATVQVGLPQQTAGALVEIEVNARYPKL